MEKLLDKLSDQYNLEITLPCQPNKYVELIILLIKKAVAAYPSITCVIYYKGHKIEVEIDDKGNNKYRVDGNNSLTFDSLWNAISWIDHHIELQKEDPTTINDPEI